MRIETYETQILNKTTNTYLLCDEKMTDIKPISKEKLACIQK